MKIYGVAILAGCFLVGKLMGALLGQWLHIDGNVGGVGFAMALLILVNTLLYRIKTIPEETAQGVGGTLACFFLVPLVAKIGKASTPKPE